MYTHYCSSTLIKQQSIIESNNICKHKHENPEPISVHNSSVKCNTGCCADVVTDECCSDKKEYFKMTGVFLLSSFTVDSKDFSRQVITTKLNKENINVESFFKEPESTFSLPPPLSGKQIVVLYHQLKTEPTSFV